MMTGIEVLSQEPIMDNGWATPCIIILLILSVVGSVILGFVTKDVISAFLFMIPFSLVSLFITSFVSMITAQPIEGKYTYKVTIDENVSMVEFYDRYEVVDQEGKIFTIKERN